MVGDVNQGLLRQCLWNVEPLKTAILTIHIRSTCHNRKVHCIHSIKYTYSEITPSLQLRPWVLLLSWRLHGRCHSTTHCTRWHSSNSVHPLWLWKHGRHPHRHGWIYTNHQPPLHTHIYIHPWESGVIMTGIWVPSGWDSMINPCGGDIGPESGSDVGCAAVWFAAICIVYANDTLASTLETWAHLQASWPCHYQHQISEVVQMMVASLAKQVAVDTGLETGWFLP